MMMPIACLSFIIMEFTNPMTITVVADEDWITQVTPAPSATPLSGVFVILYRNASSLFPATSFSASPMSIIPYRNIATPLKRATTIENTSIITLFLI